MKTVNQAVQKVLDFFNRIVATVRFRFLLWMFAWVDLVVALVSVLTLGFVNLDWDMTVRVKYAGSMFNHIQAMNHDQFDTETSARTSTNSRGNPESQ